MICPKCKGQRAIVKTNIMTATTVREQCPDCKGLGEVQGDISDGLKVKPEPGQITYFSLFKGGKPRAVMTTAIEGIVVDAKNRYLIVKIMHMKTKDKYRKQGLMDEILESVKVFGQKQVKFVITSWYDSTDIGKEFLLKRGFVREGNILIWRRDGKPKQGEGSGVIPKVSPGITEPQAGDSGGEGNDLEAGDSPGGGDPGSNPDNKD